MNLATLRRLVCLLAFAVASTAFAQVTITLNFTPTTTAYGLTQGVPAEWTFTMPSGALGSFDGDTGQMGWRDLGTLSGSGFGGQASPSSIYLNYYQDIIGDGNNLGSWEIWMSAGNGLTLGGTPVSELYGYPGVAGLGNLPVFYEPTRLDNYITAYAQGTFAVSNLGPPVSVYFSGGGAFQIFNVSSITFSVIPEPSTSAALVGLGALALAAWRRRRARSA